MRPATSAPEPSLNFKTIGEALRQPRSGLFSVSREGGQYRLGNPDSYFNRNPLSDDLTFDISNNAALANVGPQGTLKALTLYRDSYLAACDPAVAGPGVWAARDLSAHGPYAFVLALEGERFDLSAVDWDYRTGLLDNIFPLTELYDPRDRFTVRLLTFAPLTSDGQRRLRCVVYGLHLENRSDRDLYGTVHLPRLLTDARRGDRSSPDPYRFEVGRGDAEGFGRDLPFALKRGESAWAPAVLYMLGDSALQEVREHGSLAWLLETWRYFRGLLGRMETPQDPFLAQFYERQVLGAFHGIALSGGGKMAGANRGSSPAAREIRAKDAYYACLPFMSLDPDLAQKMILWFREFGMRPEGSLVEGGIHHSLGLTVADLLLGSHHYEQTGNVKFFRQHMELKESWGRRLDAILESRRDGVWLFHNRTVADGETLVDHHTGSNVCVWRALAGYSHLLDNVYSDPQGARERALEAERVRTSLFERTMIEGPFGPQFTEGTYRDERIPPSVSDGEESDATLMPFYGLLSYDDPAYLNFMRFSVSPHNEHYRPKTRGIKWGVSAGAAPGYLKGICAGVEPGALFGERGYVTELRKLADADGSAWGWTFYEGQDAEWNIPNRGPGKSGWFAGLFATLFVHRFLGLSYYAPKRILQFAPLPALGSFTWAEFPLGNDRFSLAYERTEEFTRATFTNLNAQPVRADVMLPFEGAAGGHTVSINGFPAKDAPTRLYFKHPVVVASRTLGGRGTLTFEVRNVSGA